MKKTYLTLALLASVSLANAAPAPHAASAPAATTLELDVFGLNCSLCSDAMKAKLMKLSGARDIEPRLECGKIYLDMPAGVRFDDSKLPATLKENGFSYDGVKSTTKTLAEVRKTSPDAC